MSAHEPAPGSDAQAAAQRRLLVRPPAPGALQVGPAPPMGVQPLGLGAGRDGQLYLPPESQPDQPLPLVVLLHGAGGDGRDMLERMLPPLSERALIVLAPDSRADITWDLLHDGLGADVAFLDRALHHVFSRVAVDPTHIALGGFSSGASYALSLGLTNGDIFTHVLAFSPGAVAPRARRGRPLIFIAHGTHDQSLPVKQCGRPIAARLRRDGYDVRFHEFDGPHTIPEEIAREALDWFAE